MILRGVPTGLACAILAILIGRTPFGHTLDDWFSDACFVLRGPRVTSAKVVIISIDDASFDELKKPAAHISPELARVIEFASDQGAAAIGLDYFVPASLSTRRAINDPQPSDPESEKGDGLAVGKAAIKSERVVLPALFAPGSAELRLPLRQWGIAAGAERPTPYGLLNLTNDPDMFIRRQHLALDPTKVGASVPNFFAAAVYARSRQAVLVMVGGQVRIADRIIPVDAEGRVRINFVGPTGTGAFPVISLREVLAAQREQRSLPVLRGANVIIGAMGDGQQDIHATPYSNGAARLFSKTTSSLTPGPEIHANVIATIHDQAYLTRPLWLEPLPWALLAGIGLGATFARVSLSLGAAVLAMFLITVMSAAYALFVFPGWLMNPVPVAFAALGTYAVVLARRWWQLRRMFAVVKSEAVTRALEADPRRLDPGGELRVITAMFADIRGFTTFSETCGGDPKQVVALLNEYYTTIIPVIEEYGGTIIAFMGDGLMVLFGAPVSQENHAEQGVHAALAMAQAVKANAKAWERHRFAGMRIGIGLHSGPAVIGAIGSGARKDYTAIGDTINTASRVEGETKRYNTEILLTAATRTLLESKPLLAARCQPIPELAMLKGRLEPVQLFHVS